MTKLELNEKQVVSSTWRKVGSLCFSSDFMINFCADCSGFWFPCHKWGYLVQNYRHCLNVAWSFRHAITFYY